MEAPKKTKVLSFSATDEVQKILSSFPWGKRSKFINNCIKGQKFFVEKEEDITEVLENE